MGDRAEDTESYEFDIAVSFAGEDREFVDSFVEGLKIANLNVYYDADYAAEMWGTDLIEYFDDVFRKRSRFAVVFVSRRYAEKMWTRHERRSALARGLAQTEPYVLPVRLDDTELPGLLPTVGYLDARQYGIEGVVEVAIAKVGLGQVPARQSGPAISHVPRTEVERQRVLAERPPAWEYLLFAGELLHRMTALEPKNRDHQLRFAAQTGEVLRAGEFADYAHTAISDAERLLASLLAMMEPSIQEGAFGRPGEPGDPERIQHLAARWTSIYEAFLEWAARHRGISSPAKYHTALELLARLVNKPIEEYRAFVSELVHKTDWVPAALAADRPGQVEVRVALVLTISDADVEALMREMRRVT